MPKRSKQRKRPIIQEVKMSDAEAMDRIVALVEERPGIDQMDLAQELRIDLRQTVRCCMRLLKEERIVLNED